MRAFPINPIEVDIMMHNTILIIEDDFTVLSVLTDFLNKSGFITESAGSAEEAGDILKNEAINIVLADIKLPGTNGVEFTKTLKKKYDLDIILMTGYSNEYSYVDAIKNGASDLLFKPIKLNELILRINRVIKERKLLEERDKMIKELKQLTIEDPLTRLYNSRYFFEQLDIEIKRAERYSHPISLMFIDIDNFKGINDTYGHMLGDKILSLIAQKIKICLRSNDTAYRFAGDEFTVVLPETNSSEAKIVADRILLTFADDNLVIDDKKISTITLSIGIVEYQMYEGAQQFVHRADLKMYEAKRQKGNSLFISPEIEEPAITTIR